MMWCRTPRWGPFDALSSLETVKNVEDPALFGKRRSTVPYIDVR